MKIEIKINSLEKYLANLVNDIEYKRIREKLKENIQKQKQFREDMERQGPELQKEDVEELFYTLIAE